MGQRGWEPRFPWLRRALGEGVLGYGRPQDRDKVGRAGQAGGWGGTGRAGPRTGHQDGQARPKDRDGVGRAEQAGQAREMGMGLEGVAGRAVENSRGDGRGICQEHPRKVSVSGRLGSKSNWCLGAWVSEGVRL